MQKKLNLLGKTKFGKSNGQLFCGKMKTLKLQTCFEYSYDIKRKMLQVFFKMQSTSKNIPQMDEGGRLSRREVVDRGPVLKADMCTASLLRFHIGHNSMPSKNTLESYPLGWHKAFFPARKC